MKITNEVEYYNMDNGHAIKSCEKYGMYCTTIGPAFPVGIRIGIRIRIPVGIAHLILI